MIYTEHSAYAVTVLFEGHVVETAMYSTYDQCARYAEQCAFAYMQDAFTNSGFSFKDKSVLSSEAWEICVKPAALRVDTLMEMAMEEEADFYIGDVTDNPLNEGEAKAIAEKVIFSSDDLWDQIHEVMVDTFRGFRGLDQAPANKKEQMKMEEYNGKWYVSFYRNGYVWEPAEGGYRVEERYLADDDLFEAEDEYIPLIYKNKGSAVKALLRIKAFFEDREEIVSDVLEGRKIHFLEGEGSPDNYPYFEYFTEYIGDGFSYRVERESEYEECEDEWEQTKQCLLPGTRGAYERRYEGYR
jgi:hypothetical protein